MLELGRTYRDVEVQIIDANGNPLRNESHGPLQTTHPEKQAIEICPIYQADEAGTIKYNENAVGAHCANKIMPPTQIRWVIHPPVKLS